MAILKPKPIKITDTTLRDAHQSLWATRMKTEEMVPILQKLDKVGYWSLEMWGGATFDVSIRYLREDPWERLSMIRKEVKNTKLQMLLRGQNIVGYRNYPDDLLEAFIEKSAERGIDIYRIFDALNDVRNLESAIKFVKKYKKHAQGTLCYTISPVHTIDYYLKCAKEQLNLGVDSICIKDMAGIIAPDAAFELVKRLKAEIKLPVQLHSHSSSGMVVASYLKAIEAGVDIIDTAHGPLSFATSQPAVETIIAMLANTPYNPKLSLTTIAEISEYFETIRQKRNFKIDKVIDEMVLIHQIPGGMASNLQAQLKEQNAVDRLGEVLAEVPRVRADLGYPPLVTPTSQIVGVQAVFNVLAGERYKIIPEEIKNYVRGLYGRPPAPIKEAIRKKILGNEKPISKRPADLLEPVLNKVKNELDKKYVKKEEDYITYALFPEVALKYFEQRESPSQFVEVEQSEEQDMRKEDKEGLDILKELLELYSKHNIAELEWEFAGNKVKIKKSTSTPVIAQTPFLPETKPQGYVTPTSQTTQPEQTTVSVNYEEIKSPMVGTFYSRPRPDAPPYVNKGDIVDVGETLCVIEAMKLMNEIEAEKKCKIIDILVKDGEAVEYGQALFLIEPLA
ncbi:MAG: acetyl-CoA carboxylase biotin carboxyl carrier protein [candidate division WOR-3 bacterium]|nr:acetyl-CoA carboxylase biotin carboxyl carrier protein [candidate division WOR-3 bacterium]